MSYLLALDQAERKVKDAEIRVNTIKIHIDALDREIASLLSIEQQLVDNLRFLRKIKVVAMAVEFKKTKEDLRKTSSLLSVRQNDRETHKKAYKAAEEFLSDCKAELVNIRLQGENNVIYGQFGDEDGQK